MGRDRARDLMTASYKKNSKAEKIASNHGYALDKELSSKEAKVFVNHKGEPTVAFRGTKKTSLKDIGTDLAIAVGAYKHTARHKESKKLMEKVRTKYAGKKVEAMGHSLGGKIAEGVNADKVITYNKGAGLKDIGRKIPKQQTDIRTKLDVVSGLSNFDRGKGKHINKNPKISINPLSIHSLKNLK